MIRKFIFSFMLFVGAIACSKEKDIVVDNQSDDSIITFATSVEKTKGTPIDDAGDIPSLGVVGFIESKAFIDNREANKNSDGSWSVIKPVIYWPDGEEITFFTYSPYDYARYEYEDNDDSHDGEAVDQELRDAVTNVTATPTKLSLDYKVPTTCTKQPDLMVAYHPNASKADGAVSLNHKHALASIGFKTSNEIWRGVEYVKIKNVVSEGTLTYKPTETNNQLSWAPKTSSSLEFQSNLKTTPELSYSPSIITEDGYLMMIPQNLAGVSIELGLVDFFGVQTTETITFDDTDTWEMGQQYIYDVKLKTEDRLAISIQKASADIYVYEYLENMRYSSTETKLDHVSLYDEYGIWPNIYCKNDCLYTFASISPSFEKMPVGLCVKSIDNGNLIGDPIATFRIDDDKTSVPMAYFGNDSYYQNNWVDFLNLRYKLLLSLIAFRISNSDCDITKIELHNIVIQSEVNIKTGECDVENGEVGTFTFNVNNILPNGLCCTDDDNFIYIFPQTVPDNAFIRVHTRDGKTKDIKMSREFKAGEYSYLRLDVDDLMD